MFSREYRNTRFLIIDGNSQLRMMLERMLKAFGAWYIDLSADSNEAVQKCESGNFDSVICDFQLPDRNGQYVLEELRERKILRHTSMFIMMSAETTKEMVLAAIDHQPDAYINKPITAEVLKQRMDALLVDNEVLYDIKHALDMERISEAISRCEEKISKGSRYSRWCEKTVSDLYFQQGDYKEALRVYESVLDMRPLVWAQIGVARVKMAQGEFEQAEVILLKVIDASPHCLIAYDLLAEVLASLHQYSEAQDVLAKAVAMSPTSILRHAKLGELSWDNQDIDHSVEAYRNAVELGRQSVFDKPDNHIGFARGLCERASAQPKEIRNKSINEALAVLNEANQRFSMTEGTQFQSKVISSKAYISLNDKEKAHDCLASAETLYHHSALNMPASRMLEYAQALLAADKDLEAEFVISQLTLVHGSDPEIMKRVEDIRDEPVSSAARQKAAELNRKGIELADTGSMKESIKVFLEAVDYSPRHPALNLNLAQVLIKLIGSEPANRAYRKSCEACFQRIMHLKHTHKQYPRLQHLRDKLSAISA